ncbi:MAG: TIGR02444 family protein [Proteobacteria bacterium]|nr:TIGR02444 family protein [Pseudomonadota bacterium]MBI3497812.1 TIGR02444 family protein [Pseudomonadota bacterium]
MRLYRRDGVAAACLELQDRRHLDVNLLLYCCWLGSRGVALDRRRIALTDRRIRRWRTRLIAPLRRLRRDLKDDPLGMAPAAVVSLRRQLAKAELAAEKMAQVTLAEHAPQGGRIRPDAAMTQARHNLLVYLAHAGVLPKRREHHALAALLAGMAKAARGR